jgi:Uma2 family endonuclease
MAANPKHPLTFEEYLAIERNAEIKSEFIDGEMFLMAGAGKNHNRIARNTLTSLAVQTQNGDCEVYPSNLRIKIEKLNQGRYPDISIVGGEQLFDGKLQNSLLNPTTLSKFYPLQPKFMTEGKSFKIINYSTPSLNTF